MVWEHMCGHDAGRNTLVKTPTLLSMITTLVAGLTMVKPATMAAVAPTSRSDTPRTSRCVPLVTRSGGSATPFPRAPLRSSGTPSDARRSSLRTSTSIACSFCGGGGGGGGNVCVHGNIVDTYICDVHTTTTRATTTTTTHNTHTTNNNTHTHTCSSCIVCVGLRSPEYPPYRTA